MYIIKLDLLDIFKNINDTWNEQDCIKPTYTMEYIVALAFPPTI